MRRFGLLFLLLLPALGGLAACEVDKVQPPPDDDASAAPDVSSIDPGSGQTFIDCDRENGDADCPVGMFCETKAQVCVECLVTVSRCGGGGREVCHKPLRTGLHEVEDGFFVPAPCAPGEVCVETGSEATCEDKICQPFEWQKCDPAKAGKEVRCDHTGTALEETDCGGGQACYGDRCARIRHNVLLIFDTSGSMNKYVHTDTYPSATTCGTPEEPCIGPFPTCDGDDPLTLITASKKVFAENINETVDDQVQFALQRFPQQERHNWSQATCTNGYYQSNVDEVITGDDGAWTTEPGGFFDKHYPEAVVVPFPIYTHSANTDQLLAWMDNYESLGGSALSCQVDTDCPGGKCGTDGDGSKSCRQHINPELRAGGQTPLGKSLFYAGEYLRRFVVVEGKPCERTSECLSVGYTCHEGVCTDPTAHCRENFIIMFTDGQQTPPPDDPFFEPKNQAKRLAWGLGCQVDADCHEQARCIERSTADGPVTLCVPSACVVNSDCSTGAICVDGVCVPRSCNPATPAACGEAVCVKNGPDHWCLPQCDTALDCPVGASCDAGGRCMPGSCETDQECPDQARCQGGHCLPWVQDSSGLPDYVAGSDGDILENPWGVRVRIVTSVVSLVAHDSYNNSAIAKAGGGKLLEVSADDEEKFRDDLRELMQNVPKCEPKEL